MVFLQGFFNKDGQWDFRDGMQKQMEFYARNKKIIKMHLNAIEKKRTVSDVFCCSDDHKDAGVLSEKIPFERRAGSSLSSGIFSCRADSGCETVGYGGLSEISGRDGKIIV